MEEVTLQQLHELQERELSPTRLLGANKNNTKVERALLALFPAETNFTSASTALIDGCEVRAGDVVILSDGRIGEVWFHATVTADLVSCVSVWSETSSTRYTKSADKSDNPCIVQLESIQMCLMYTTNSAGDKVTVLSPPRLRD